MSVEQMKIRILDLVDRQALIIDPNDREFILGLAALLEMDEPVDGRYAERVGRIWAKVQENSVG